jgi:hypothetical protein
MLKQNKKLQGNPKILKALRVDPRENRADSCNVGYIDVPDFAQSNFFG